MLAAIGIAEPQSAEYAFDEDNAAQDVGSTSKARFGPRDLREGKTSLTQYPKILHAEYPLGEAFDIADEAQSENDVPKLTVQVPRPVGVSRTPREDAGKNFAHGAENVADAEGTR
jgi:hypothetical protein